MKISKRLKAICDLVPKNSKVIDIGADHGLVDIYLTKYKNCQCLATDISKNALEKAKENSKKYKTKINTLVTNGLENINLDDEIIIISGLGTHNIIKILNKNITNDIVISTHTNVPLIRKYMYKKGYHIQKEISIYEKHHYVITYYKYGKGKRINYIISPFLTNNHKYMEHLLKNYKLKYKFEKNKIKKLKYQLIIIKIKKHLTTK